ncbi:transcriptional regulator [Latilactobacillus sakei subsp. sakei]|uniref:transcriptional regulator n=1 Tax=Latilactobacillus sakei TaxID=1599 RepID=UPI0028548B8B|nr:transcriptional regulator [Latilactobacillus sakei]MDR7924345.1 transcriptional regulator [Latilactobacillus sakei subsp. sakei]
MDKSLAKQIRIKLIERDWNLSNLANSLNLSTAYVSDILNGKKDGPKAQEHIQTMIQILDINEVIH